jgi:hypothetical protein
MLTDLNNFIKNILTVKSSVLKSDFVRVPNPNSIGPSTGRHLFVTKCNRTSSYAIQPTFPEIALAAR